MNPNDRQTENGGPVTFSSLPQQDLLGLTARAVLRVEAWIQQEMRGPRSALVRAACDDVELTAEFVRGVAGEFVDVVSALREESAYLDACRAIHADVRAVHARLILIDQHDHNDRHRSARALETHSAELRRGLFDAVVSFRAVVDQVVVDPERLKGAQQLAETVEDELLLRGFAGADAAEHAAHRTFTRLRGLLDKARRTTGDIGAQALGHEYEKHAKDEAHVADVLRWWAVGLSVAAAAAALWFSHTVTQAPLPVALARLSVTVPLGLLAIYLGKESARHRQVARWSSELSIALRTVDAFIEGSSSKTDGRALRHALGMRVYGSTPDRAEPLGTQLTDQLLDPVRKVSESVQGLGEAAQRLRDVVEKPRGGRQP
jgi:hypothetical protein